MTKPFHFKLEKILVFRKQLEDQAKLALAQAKQQEEAQNRVLCCLEEALEACLTSMATDKHMTQADLWLWTSYKKRLEADKSQGTIILKNIQNQVAALRQELVTRSTQRKLLEKLRAKQAEKHAHVQQNKEQKEFDETATLRYGRSPY
jgi:flagellar FliJ protein